MINLTIQASELFSIEDEDMYKTEVFLAGEWQGLYSLSNMNALFVNGIYVRATDKIKIRIAD